MTVKVVGLLAGVAFGFVLSWAQVTDPAVIRNMLLLREPHVFLIMGSAIAVAAVGCRVLRALGTRAFLTRDEIRWTLVRPQQRHVAGSVLFGIGWCIAGTCPGPAAAMIGQGKVGGVVVGIGILAGVVLHQATARVIQAGSRHAEPARVEVL